MHAAGWALGIIPGHNETDLTWSALPAADERRITAEADGVLALAGQLREVFGASDQDWCAVARHAVEVDEALDLCTEWLDGECWRPDDGAAEAARVVWAASKLVDEESVRAWVAARRGAK